MLKQSSSLAKLLIAGLLTGVIAGCGGNGDGGAGGDPSQPRSVQVSIDWPARSRAIIGTSSALSAIVTLTGASSSGADVVFMFNRPTGTDEITIPAASPFQVMKNGDFNFTIAFKAKENGTGDTVATGTAMVHLEGGAQVNDLTTQLGSISITKSVNSVAVVPGQQVMVNTSQDIAFTAKTASGSLLALTQGSAFISVAAGGQFLEVVSGQARGKSVGTASVVCTVDGISSPAVDVQVIPPAAQVTTLAGAGDAGATDGQGSVARFNNPAACAVDQAGNVFVTDFDNEMVRMVTPGGLVTTVVSQANFSRPFGIAVGGDGTVYVQTDANDLGQRDSTTGTIWKVNLDTKSASVVARNLGRPRGIAVFQDGRIAMSDLAHNVVRILNPSTGVVTNVAGAFDSPGFLNGSGTNAKFDRAYGVTVLPSGDMLVADQNNNQIRKVTQAGVVTTFAGSQTAGTANGGRVDARFFHPQDVKVDASSNLVVSDNGNHLIRYIAAGGTVSTLAGNGIQGFADGTGPNAQFYGQEGVCILANGTIAYVADGNGGDGSPFNRLRKIVLP